MEARGALIGILSDDDVYAPELLATASSLIDENPNAIGVYPDWDIVDEAGRLIEEHRLPAFSRDALLFWQWCLPGPGAIVRKDVLLRIGGRDSSFRFISDYDMWIRATRHGEMIHIPEKLAYWRHHQSNATTSQRQANMAEERLRLARKTLSDPASHNCDPWNAELSARLHIWRPQRSWAPSLRLGHGGTCFAEPGSHPTSSATCHQI